MKGFFTGTQAKGFTRAEGGIDAEAEASQLAQEIQQGRALHPSSYGNNGGKVPAGLLTNGEVMIRGLHLVAWPAGSEWRNPRRQHSPITTSRRESS